MRWDTHSPGAREIDRNGLEVLDRDECLQLLERSSVGRIAVTAGALPTILPINFRLVDDVVVFRTGRGSKLLNALNRNVVAFEVDDIDPFAHNGWSVVVTGVASVVDDPARAAELEAMNVPRWAPSPDERFVTVTSDFISGRRLSYAVRSRFGAAD